MRGERCRKEQNGEERERERKGVKEKVSQTEEQHGLCGRAWVCKILEKCVFDPLHTTIGFQSPLYYKKVHPGKTYRAVLRYLEGVNPEQNKPLGTTLIEGTSLLAVWEMGWQSPG